MRVKVCSVQFAAVAQSRPTLCDPLSITNLWHLPKLMSIESLMPSNHFILCHPLLPLPSIFPSIRVFSNESALSIRWPEYFSHVQLFVTPWTVAHLSPPSIRILLNCCRSHLFGEHFTPSQCLCWELCIFLFSKINPIHFLLWVSVCSWGSFFSFINKNSDSPFRATWETRCFCNNNNINKIKMLCFYNKLQIKGINFDQNLVKCFCITSLFW